MLLNPNPNPNPNPNSNPNWKTLEVAEVAEIYVIEAIVDSRVPSGGTSIEYKVKWRGWQGQDTWEPVSNIRGRGDAMINQYVNSIGRRDKTESKRRKRVN